MAAVTAHGCQAAAGTYASARDGAAVSCSSSAGAWRLGVATGALRGARLCAEHSGFVNLTQWSRRCNSVAVSAVAASPQLDVENRAEKGSPAVLLEVKDLRAVVRETGMEILKGVDLIIREGEVHAIMGRNGSGKSTLSKVLVGHPDYEVTGGSAIFKGEDLLDKEPAERSHNGLFLSFQSPVEIPGVSNMDFLRMACNARRGALGLPELGPLEVLEADLAILDEIDSGLDIDALRDVATAVIGLQKESNAVLMITHYQRLLEYIKPTYVHIMESGRITKTGDMSLATQLEAGGYNAVKGSST